MISGRRLNRLIRWASATDRALLAYELEQGAIQVLRPTRTQAATLTRASSGYIGAIARLSADERTQLARGWFSLSRAHNRRRNTDAEIDRIVAAFGAEAIMAALDRATAPTRQQAVG
jgi:hypothetical protein